MDIKIKKTDGDSSRSDSPSIETKKVGLFTVMILVIIIVFFVFIGIAKSLSSNKAGFGIHPNINTPTIEYDNSR